MKQEKVIMYESAEAAQFRTDISGWVSSDGRFWGKDEHMARYSGSTHKLCECGQKMRRGSIKCDQCYAASQKKKYDAMPFQEWNGTDTLYSEALDKYFFNEDDLLEHIEGEGDIPHHLRLVICEPNNFNHVDADYWSDIMPDDSDGELPKKLDEALKALNAVIDQLPPASYCPGKFRTTYKVPAP